MNFVIAETGWSREYVGWKTNYPWLKTWLSFRKGTPSCTHSLHSLNGMIKSYFGVSDPTQQEEIKGQDSPEAIALLGNMATLSKGEAETKLKSMGIDPKILALLDAKNNGGEK